MGIISVEHIDRLIWLGRYSERTYTMIRLYSKEFDLMIDYDPQDYIGFCEKLNIANIYKNPADFLHRYGYDEEDPNSVISNLKRAYNNAIVLREEIGSEPLSYIQLAIYEMEKGKNSRHPLIELMKVNDNILAFWGIVDDSIESEKVRNIIKIGKRIERIDLYARFGASTEEMRREIHRLVGRIGRTGLKYSIENLEKLSELAEKTEMEYKEILRLVDSLIE